MKDEPRSHPFRDSTQDIETAKHVPDTPQTRSPVYRLAFADRDFMTREELRPVRLQLELLKPQMIMDERGIESTVVMFGGARIPAPDRKETARTPALADLSRYYDEARRFAAVMTERSLETYGRNWVVVTGGGPGNSTTFLSIDLVKMAVGQFDLGPAAAFSLMYFLVILLVSWVFYTVMTNLDRENAQ